MSIELSTIVVRTEGMMTAPVDNEIVILNMNGNNYISLDDVGRRIWEQIEQPISVNDLCHILVAEFDATQEQIALDVIPFLAELEHEGLLRAVD